ncbi:MAG: hypothetical protein NC206_03255 [Bacteroides sp.]|nr:hypothetical protein [Roseburia sp.]MCM1346082.1 hypothetical protein [Bacteroides sp.]MCM1420424.1 hypothetical protein [Bacteroides sp.]
MKQKLLLFATSMLVGASMSAQWTVPVPATSDLQVSEGTDTVVYYLYNKDAGMFYTEGNDWGTRASIGTTGLQVFVSKYQAPGETEGSLLDWDGKSYILNNYSVAKGKWANFFFDTKSAATCYVDYDGRDNADYLLEWAKVGDSYRFWGAEANDNVTPDNYPGAYIGVDRSITADNTVVTGDVEKDLEDTPNTLLVDWQFVTTDNYAAYLAKYEVYEAAESLKAIIEEAKDKNVDTSAAETVYNNTNSTKEELEATTLAVKEAIALAIENSVSPSNPKDMTAEYVTNPDFENDTVEGWLTTTGASNSKTATNKSDGVHFTGISYENWNANPFAGKTYQVLRNIPKGIYTVQMGAFCSYNSGAYVYANSDSVEVVSSNPNTYAVTTLVDVDTLEIGVKQNEALSNWVGLDNVKVTYYGNSNESYKLWIDGIIESAPDFNNTDEYCLQVATLEAYNATLEVVKAANTKEEILAATANYKSVLAETKANADAYAAFVQTVEYGNATMEKGFEGPEADILGDYLIMEDEPSDENPYGTATYILNTRTLSTAEIIEETARLQAIIDYVIKNCLGADMDATDLMTNPNFDGFSTAGWSCDESLSKPVGGGLESNPCVEVYANNFDSYQLLTDIPNGVYELTVQAFYRTGSSTTTAYNEYKAGNASEILTEIYVNGLSAPVCDIASETFSENLESNCEEVETGVFVPNGMTSASNAFSQGRYTCSVMGVVTDGTMRVGIRSNASAGGRWALWDNFRLTYRAYNAETIQQILEPLIEEVETFQEETEVIGKVEADNLESEKIAAEKALGEMDGQAMFAAYSTLSEALTAAKASAAAYVELMAANEELGLALNSSSASQATLDAANELVNEVAENIEEGEYTVEEAAAKVEEIKEMITKLNIPENATDASDENPVDMTALIVNPSFETLDESGNVTAYGWAGTTPSGFNNENTNAEFYYDKVKTYDMYQTINGLLDGTYKVSVQAFYRAGTSAEDYKGALINSTDSLHAFLYATSGEETASVPVQHLGSGAKTGGYNGGTDEASVANGIYVPNTMSTGAMAFLEEAYVNSVIIKVTGNKLTIGLKKEQSLKSDWTLFDNWTLTYYGANSAQTPDGDASGIEGVASDAAVVSVAYYTLGGARIAAPNKGINIVKTVLADGTVTVSKVLVK